MPLCVCAGVHVTVLYSSLVKSKVNLKVSVCSVVSLSVNFAVLSVLLITWTEPCFKVCL